MDYQQTETIELRNSGTPYLIPILEKQRGSQQKSHEGNQVDAEDDEASLSIHSS